MSKSRQINALHFIDRLLHSFLKIPFTNTMKHRLLNRMAILSIKLRFALPRSVLRQSMKRRRPIFRLSRIYAGLSPGLSNGLVPLN